MLEFDEATRRALIQRYGPTPDAQARVLAELRSTLGGPLGPEPGGGGEGGPPIGGAPGGTGQVVWITKICAATAGLTGAGLLVLKLGASVLSSSDEREEVREAEATVEVRTPAREPPRTTAAPDPPLQRDAPSPTPMPVQSPTKRSTDASGSTLAAELVLLDGAKRIQSSDPKAALVLLDQHQQKFPTGVLAPERELLRLEVSCALGHEIAARCSGTASNKTGD